jgi:hypothetical protein
VERILTFPQPDYSTNMAAGGCVALSYRPPKSKQIEEEEEIEEEFYS